MQFERRGLTFLVQSFSFRRMFEKKLPKILVTNTILHI